MEVCLRCYTAVWVFNVLQKHRFHRSPILWHVTFDNNRHFILFVLDSNAIQLLKKFNKTWLGRDCFGFSLYRSLMEAFWMVGSAALSIGSKLFRSFSCCIRFGNYRGDSSIPYTAFSCFCHNLYGLVTGEVSSLTLANFWWLFCDWRL